MKKSFQLSRRTFIEHSYRYSVAAFSVYSFSSLTSCQSKQEKEEKSEQNVSEQQASKKLGIALVGLGNYSKGQLAPALQETQHCYLSGIVTGSPDKADEWKTKYNIPEKNIYNYENFDQIKDNPDIDIIYVVLPNAMHKEFVVRAAKAGKHVICEKPMAVTVQECDEMIAACKEAGKMLSIGYRLRFEPYNREMTRFGTEKVFGNIKKVIAENGMSDTEGWRLNKALAGGGSLMDVGIYAIQGVRYTTGMEPIAVTAKEGPKKDKDRFKDIEDSLSWTMEMPGGIIAECKTAYTNEMNKLRLEGENGWAELSPAYPYKGIKGETSNGKMDFPEVNQQALQMDAFAQAIKENKPSTVPGEMGKQDVKIIQAIYEAMRTGKKVTIS
ncbi:Gfo/Idh/MocA family protein [Chryseosolibacter indicus]|uniref:Gfo/Idh/MocA family oxidoreductase n=1 Tax=Chryseosolibacter indicus TaxID=2782351 RepID=A0ABS5VNA0_9BACT|nr:Gfo/Idh/MocA family oxidoreductase [Chryseosolibacter indicus]MBT1702247.1 Gfo/Idh/MocA family oxidoreductase [Chryseosolibacter indicus]